MSHHDQAARVFFYGSFINRDILRRGGVEAGHLEVAVLYGYDIRLETLATLVRDEHSSVYGVLTEVPHAALAQLYGQSWLENAYVPHAVIVQSEDGRLVPALCFITHDVPPARPSPDYVEWILFAARELAFPSWYIDHLMRAGTGFKG